jgi:hypothetical protein
MEKNLTKGNKRKEPKIKVLTHELLDNKCISLIKFAELSLKGQPGARSSCLRSVRGRIRPLWVYQSMYATLPCISARGCFQD